MFVWGFFPLTDNHSYYIGSVIKNETKYTTFCFLRKTKKLSNKSGLIEKP